MRLFLLLPLATLAACSSFDSPCENINAAQDDAAMQTCVFSASLDENGAGTFSPDDGAPADFTIAEREPLATAFPDGSTVSGGMWIEPGEAVPAAPDSSRMLGASAIAPEATRYAIGARWDGAVTIRTDEGRPLAAVRVASGEDQNAARMGISGWPNRATHLAFSSGGATLFGADTRGTVTAWDATTGETLWDGMVALDHGGEDGRAVTPDGVRALAVSPDGSRVAAAGARGVSVWDAASGESVAEWAFPKGKTSVIDIAFAPDGQHVAVTKSGRYIPSSVRYSSFDENGQRTSTPEMQRTEAQQNPPTVFLMALP